MTGACKDPGFQPGYFGYKVLGVSYGATVQLFGYKGTPLPKAAPKQQFPSFNFGGLLGLFNPQGAPSQFASQSAPATSGQGSGSAGNQFLKLYRSRNGSAMAAAATAAAATAAAWAVRQTHAPR